MIDVSTWDVSEMEVLTWALGIMASASIAALGYILKQQGSIWRKTDNLAQAVKDADKALADYKLYVAENYVSVRTFEKFESRLLDAIKNLEKMVREDIADHRKS